MLVQTENKWSNVQRKKSSIIYNYALFGCLSLRDVSEQILRSDNLDNVLLTGMVFGPRGRGRPKTRFWDDIRQLTSMGIREAVRLAQDRDGWRLMVQRATAGRNRPIC